MKLITVNIAPVVASRAASKECVVKTVAQLVVGSETLGVGQLK